jgi:hypothetical protein
VRPRVPVEVLTAGPSLLRCSSASRLPQLRQDLAHSLRSTCISVSSSRPLWSVLAVFTAALGRIVPAAALCFRQPSRRAQRSNTLSISCLSTAFRHIMHHAILDPRPCAHACLMLSQE